MVTVIDPGSRAGGRERVKTWHFGIFDQFTDEKPLAYVLGYCYFPHGRHCRHSATAPTRARARTLAIQEHQRGENCSEW